MNMINQKRTMDEKNTEEREVNPVIVKDTGMIKLYSLLSHVLCQSPVIPNVKLMSYYILYR